MGPRRDAHTPLEVCVGRLQLLVLVGMYAAPTAAVLQQAAAPTTKVLPSLVTPRIAVPLLRVPKLHAPPPLAALRTARTTARRARYDHREERSSAAKAFRRRIPVVTDKYSQFVSSRGPTQPAAHDPFANAPVATDESARRSRCRRTCSRRGSCSTDDTAPAPNDATAPVAPECRDVHATGDPRPAAPPRRCCCSSSTISRRQ